MGLFNKQKHANKSDNITISPTNLLDAKVWIPKNFETNFNDFSYGINNADLFLKYAYGKNPYVFTVIDDIARVCSRLERNLKDAKEEVIQPNNIFLAATLKRPNQKQGLKSFYKLLLTHLLATGNAFIRRQTLEGYNRPFFSVLHTPSVKIETVDGNLDGVVSSYVYDGKYKISPRDVLHIKYDNPVVSSNWGLSPLSPLRLVYEGANDAFEAKAHIHKNRGAAGLLSPKDAKYPNTPREQRTMTSWLKAMLGGPREAGAIHIASTAMEYTKFGMSITDLKSLEALVSDLRAICAAYGVNSVRYNDTTASTYNNLQESTEQFYRDVVLPLALWIDNELSEFIFKDTFNLDYYFSVNRKAITVLNKPDAVHSAMIVEQAKAGILSNKQALAILHPELQFEGLELNQENRQQ